MRLTLVRRLVMCCVIACGTTVTQAAATADLSGVPESVEAGQTVTVKLVDWPSPAAWVWLGPEDDAGGRAVIGDGTAEHTGTLTLTVPRAQGRCMLLIQTPQAADGPQAGRPVIIGRGAAPARRIVIGLQLRTGATYRNLIVKGGLSWVWKGGSDITFEDCDFIDGRINLAVQGKKDDSVRPGGWTFRRCTFKNARPSTEAAHSHGAYLYRVDDFVFEDCAFEHNGWGNNNARWNQNHNVYLDQVGDITFRGCTFIEAAAQGIKVKGVARLLVEDCTFRDNLVDISGDNRFPGGAVTIRNCTFTDTGGIDSDGRSYAWPISFEHPNHPLGPIVVSNCVFTGPAQRDYNSPVRAIYLAGGRLVSATISGCDFTHWSGPTIVNKIGARSTIAPDNKGVD